MPIFKLKFLEKKTIANNTVLFRFEKPANFSFIPGQYGGFTLINPSQVDPSGITRRFSLVSAPDDNQLEIAIRMQPSTYKQMLNQLEPGNEIKFAGPTGNFVLHEDQSVPAVLIAGGIGITPFYCMIKNALAHQSRREIYLFYGNRSPADTAFFEDLQQLSEKNKNFKLIYVMEQADHGWNGEVGYVTHTILKKYLSDLSVPYFYICGSPAMVTALHETLLELGIESEKIKTEDFPGY